jgi:hypothetical protein
MNKKELQAFAQAAAKNIKSPVSLLPIVTSPGL